MSTPLFIDINGENQEMNLGAKATAKQKAKILTEEAGIQLCEILDIDYSWINVEFETNNINFCKSYALVLTRNFDL